MRGSTRRAEEGGRTLSAPNRPTHAADQGSERWKRVVLLGFMTSGKTHVGRTLARRLRWRHVDLDHEIEQKAGTTIEAIFADRGEAAFRALEVEATPKVLEAERIILSPGGGWITNPGILETLPPETLTVWLKVSPEEVFRRLSRSRSQRVRPLLQGQDRTRVETLLDAREPLYARADAHIETDHLKVGQVTAELLEFIRGGNPSSIIVQSRA